MILRAFTHATVQFPWVAYGLVPIVVTLFFAVRLLRFVTHALRTPAMVAGLHRFTLVLHTFTYGYRTVTLPFTFYGLGSLLHTIRLFCVGLLLPPFPACIRCCVRLPVLVGLRLPHGCGYAFTFTFGCYTFCAIRAVAFTLHCGYLPAVVYRFCLPFSHCLTPAVTPHSSMRFVRTVAVHTFPHRTPVPARCLVIRTQVIHTVHVLPVVYLPLRLPRLRWLHSSAFALRSGSPFTRLRLLHLPLPTTVHGLRAFPFTCTFCVPRLYAVYVHYAVTPLPFTGSFTVAVTHTVAFGC